MVSLQQQAIFLGARQVKISELAIDRKCFGRQCRWYNSWNYVSTRQCQPQPKHVLLKKNGYSWHTFSINTLSSIVRTQGVILHHRNYDLFRPHILFLEPYLEQTLCVYKHISFLLISRSCWALMKIVFWKPVPAELGAFW